MILYMMRHAEAVEAREDLKDEWRYLTGKGRTRAAETAAAVVRLGPKPRLTLTSPLTRAVQTAEIAARTACRRNRVVATELLLPGGDIAALISCIYENSKAGRVMLVGHEPQLGALAAALLSRNEGEISLQKGACLALELDRGNKGDHVEFLWYQAPGKKTVTSLRKMARTS